MSGKYYRTRSLSQNLQQIFQPNRQSHSRSTNNLSADAPARPTTLEIKKSATAQQLNIPNSLPQSPRIHIESADSSFYMIPSHYSTVPHSKSLNFSSSTQVYPTFNYPIQQAPPPSAMKLKGYNLGEHRRHNYARSFSVEAPKSIKPFQKRPSWEERRQQQLHNYDRYQIDEAVKENSELLRKYSDPKVHDPCSSLSLWQSTFKAKLASLFRNKKKYTIMEPLSSGKETGSDHYCGISRAYSAQSLPALVNSQKHVNRPKGSKKDRKHEKKLKVDGKLKTLSLNPPQMIGGSFDNLLMINRLNKKKKAVGTYDTYHGRPLMSHASRLKALYKYRKPSESDDATTLSYEYDSGDLSDSSSLAHSSSENEEGSSSFSDVTNKSSNRAYRLRMSTSVHSMPSMKLKRELSKRSTSTQSPACSLDTPQFSNIPSNSSTFYSRDSMTMAGNQHYYPIASFSSQKPLNFINNSTAVAATANTNFNAQMIKNFFTSGPGSSNEFPLVSLIRPAYLSLLYFSLKYSLTQILNIHTLISSRRTLNTTLK